MIQLQMIEGCKRIVRLNPENVPAPVGKYSHVTIIPIHS